MAALANPPFISVDEYINSAFRPDLEYVEGVLVERSVPTIAHSVLQMILVQYFGLYQRQFGFLSLPEVRTQIVERARYRIPDLMLCPVPLPAGKIVTSSPWAVVEILSPDDRLPALLERFRDYKRIGVRHVILLDPDHHIAFRFEDGSLLKTQFTALDLPSGDVPFETEKIFAELTDALK